MWVHSDRRGVLLEHAVQRVLADEIEMRVDRFPNDAKRIDQQPLILDAAQAGDLDETKRSIGITHHRRLNCCGA